MSAAVDRAAALLRDAIGLRIDDTSRRRLAHAVRAAARDRGEPPEAYVARLAAERDELDGLIDAVAVHETAFFRDPEHFEILTARALPELGREGVVWCAGCAHGPEAWSLAMALEEGGFGGWTVVATDVARGALDRARAATYAESELRGLGPARRARFLRRAPDGRFEIVPRLRERVRMRRHNLATELPPPEAGSCPVVFWRNVLIYLDHDAQERALGRLRKRMPAGGWLFLGGSESVLSSREHFDAERFGGALAYRPHPPARNGAPSRGRPAAAAPRRARPAREPGAEALTAEGERRAAAGETAEAVAAFRRAAALAPRDPLAHVRLGLALERAGRAATAAAAFRAARDALAHAGAAPVEPGLEGWSPAELDRLLDERLGPPA